MDRLKEYACENKIPIMQEDGILFLTEYIRKNNVKKILEIGTAIGYSAINMALVSDDVVVTTIEKDAERYNEALCNIKEFGLENRIKVILGDALEVNVDGIYDLIFIDAAKAQYIKFFEKFKNNLSLEGTIISDNLDFHGLVSSDVEIKNRNLKQLVRKINNYRDFLENNKEFHTDFLTVGDGIGVSKRS